MQPFLLSLFLSALVSAVLALVSWRRRHVPGASPLSVLLLAVASWSLLYALELLGRDLAQATAVLRLEYLAIVAIPAAWLAFALRYTGQWVALTPRRLALIGVVPLCTTVVIWTNDLHGLFWRELWLDQTLPFTLLRTVRGPWFWVHTAFSYLALLIGSLLLARAVLGSSLSSRPRGLTLLLGVLIPWISNAVFLAGLSPVPGLDLTPFALTLSGGALALGIIRFGMLAWFLGLIPLARGASFHAQHDALVILDPEGTIVDANPAAERLFERPRGRLVGRPAANAAPAWAAWVTVASYPTEREVELVLGDGPLQRSFELAMIPLRVAPGSLAGWSLVLHEVTERKQADLQARQLLREQVAREQAEAAQRAIARERSTLEAIMGSMSDGLVVLDPGDVIRYANARSGELLGFNGSPLIGWRLSDAFAGVRRLFRDPERVWESWESARARLETHPSFEATAQGPPPRDVRFQLFPVHEPDSEDGVGVLLRDVTAERELERAKDELVAVVSHELRTPLTSLLGFTELLLAEPRSADQQRLFLTTMLHEGKRLAALINDFLDLQHLGSGARALHFAPTQVYPLLMRAVASAGEDSERPVLVEVPSELQAALMDEARIEQVLAKLLANARKYSPQGGQVVLSARTVDGMIAIAVRDQGIGIPAEALPRLFQKFYRVDNSDRRSATGIGLGLAIVRNVVEAHGGRAWAESAGLDQGSTFTFTLPIAETTEREPAAPE